MGVEERGEIGGRERKCVDKGEVNNHHQPATRDTDSERRCTARGPSTPIEPDVVPLKPSAGPRFAS